MLTIKEIAAQTKVCQTIVRGWITSGRLVCIRLGAAGKRGAIRVLEADLAAFLESLKTQKGPEAIKPPAPPQPPRVKLKNLKLKPA